MIFIVRMPLSTSRDFQTVRSFCPRSRGKIMVALVVASTIVDVMNIMDAVVAEQENLILAAVRKMSATEVSGHREVRIVRKMAVAGNMAVVVDTVVGAVIMGTGVLRKKNWTRTAIQFPVRLMLLKWA
jgi:hypothetical protein